MIQKCCTLTLKAADEEKEMHIPLAAIIDITSEFIQKKKEAADMVKQMYTSLSDAKLNKMACVSCNTKFFDSDVHLCD